MLLMNSRYVKKYHCRACGVRMSFHAKMYSHGTCPYCGHTVDGTVCATVERVVKEPIISKTRLIVTLVILMAAAVALVVSPY